MKIPVNLSADHIKSLTVTNRPLTALAEVIWNGLDADANRVAVHFDRNKLDGLDAIRVSDDGTGINFDHAENLFGNLGDSWKKTKNRTTGGRGLHGKNGKGRFRAFGLGSLVEWNTTAHRDGVGLVSYKIAGSSAALKNFDVSEPAPAKNGGRTGTEVTITNLHKEFGSLTGDRAVIEATKEFACYLANHPGVVIAYNGVTLDPAAVQERAGDLSCDEVTLMSGAKTKPIVRVVEWKTPVERSLHLCDEKGVSLYEITLGASVRAPGFNFTAYVMSPVFRELDKDNLLILEEAHPDVTALVDAGKKALKAYFRRREAEDLSQSVARWKEEKIYPYEEKAELSPVEAAERQVFDIVAINVQEYLPDFEDSAESSKRFTFRLLSQALRDNPESLQQIIGEVLGLKKDDQDELAELLKKTPLPAIIAASKIVANRLDFITGLENLLFDKETKQALLERDQLHKILEKESWLLGEEFALTGSELRLEEVLKKHLGKLGTREDKAPVEVGDGKTGRIDLMLQKALQPRTGEFDYLVVELKRPSKKIDSEVLSQIESYAIAVASDERFQGVKAQWTFLAVSNEMDNHAKAKATQRQWPKGKVFDHAELNITVWAKTWAVVLNDAKARLRFFREQLTYEADRDSAKQYLKKAHAKYLPSPSVEAVEPESPLAPAAAATPVAKSQKAAKSAAPKAP
jgi:hypothetical protein